VFLQEIVTALVKK
jgi:hypothetical protein